MSPLRRDVTATRLFTCATVQPVHNPRTVGACILRVFTSCLALVPCASCIGHLHGHTLLYTHLDARILKYLQRISRVPLNARLLNSITNLV